MVKDDDDDEAEAEAEATAEAEAAAEEEEAEAEEAEAEAGAEEEEEEEEEEANATKKDAALAYKKARAKGKWPRRLFCSTATWPGRPPLQRRRLYSLAVGCAPHAGFLASSHSSLPRTMLTQRTVRRKPAQSRGKKLAAQ